MKLVNLSIAGATSITDSKVYWNARLEYKGNVKDIEGIGDSGYISLELAVGIAECLKTLKEKCEIHVFVQNVALVNFVNMLEVGEIDSKEYVMNLNNAREWEEFINSFDRHKFDIFHIDNKLLYRHKNLAECITRSSKRTERGQ